MKVYVNGQESDVRATTLEELARELKLAGRAFALEVNKTVVARSRHAETRLNEGDRVEIVEFVGGG